MKEIRTQITLQSSGKKIFGILHLPEGTQKVPVVLFCNGFYGFKCGKYRLAVRQAEALLAQGIASFRFDYRSTGDSEGGVDDISIMSQLNDIAVCYDFLLEHDRIDSERMGINGRSMGGALAVVTASRKPFRAVSLWAPMYDSSPWLLKELEHRAVQFENGHPYFLGNRLSKTFLAEFESFSVEESLAALKETPIQIIQPMQDQILGDYHFKKYCSQKKLEVVTVEKSGHDFDVPEEQGATLEKTTEFFKKEL